VQNSWPVVTSASVLLLTPVVFLLGWVAGLTTFARVCESYRRTGLMYRLVYLLPILVACVAAVGFFGGGYWWLISPVVAIVGHRKGTQCAWWSEVTMLASAFRTADSPRPLVATDEEALAEAKAAINKQIGRRP